MLRAAGTSAFGRGRKRSLQPAPAQAAPSAGQPGATEPAAVPALGERRTFQVWRGANDFEDVSAVAEWIGAEVAIFVDENAPSGGFDADDYEEFAGRFDDVIYPEVTDLFGGPSDLDANERVIVLFTPVVNSLTPSGSTGFIGGFFFGNDLLPENTGSNRGEVFYALVPDPTGIHSDPRTRKTVLDVVPAVLAHEFQHMVQFNQRFLLLDAGQEALWLAEALAQMAEEVVARRYEELGDPGSAEIFRAGCALARLQVPDGPRRHQPDRNDRAGLPGGAGCRLPLLALPRLAGGGGSPGTAEHDDPLWCRERGGGGRDRMARAPTRLVERDLPRRSR